MNRLKEARLERKLSQKEVAKLLNVSQATYSNWENAKFDSNQASLKKLAEIYDVSIDYLLGAEKKEPQAKASDSFLKKAIEQAGLTDYKLTEKEMTILRGTLQGILNSRNQK